MPQNTVLGIDQGTTATKAFLLHANGEFRQLLSLEHRQIYPQTDWVEHDPLELLVGVERCLENAWQARGAGLANQGETVVAWDADSGKPLYNAIVWQDNRTRDVTDRLKADGLPIAPEQHISHRVERAAANTLAPDTDQFTSPFEHLLR